MYPSIKTIQNRLSVPRETAKQIRAIMESISPGDLPNGKRWRDFGSMGEQKMQALNAILEGHGVEAIRGNWVSHFYQDIQAAYVNMGDTYTATVLLDHETGRFIVTDCGTWIETNERKRGIQ
jgi:hypothetical protein